MFDSLRLGGFVLLVASSASVAGAQGPSPSFEELRKSLTGEPLVVVTDRFGQETLGRITEITASVVTLRVPEMTARGLSWTASVTRAFASAAVAEIRGADALGRKGPLIFATTAPSFRRPATTLSELGSFVGPGTAVVLSDGGGGCVRGTIASMTDRFITLSGRSEPYRVDEITDVKVRLNDSPWNGAAIGLAVGFVVPAMACTTADASEATGCTLLAFLLGGLPGLGIGFATDASHRREVTVYRAPGAGRLRQLSVSPVVSGNLLALHATVRY
jgi:hypothetical protein